MPTDPDREEKEEKALGMSGLLGFQGHVCMEFKPVLKSIINSEIIYLVFVFVENVEVHYMISA